MTILDKIIARKREEVQADKKRTSFEALTQLPFFSRTPLSLKEFILKEDKSGIIAEYKRASPSKGIINDRNTVEEVVKGYEQSGASAISVLTDSDFFKGSLADLQAARAAVSIPLLRKEFIIDPFQIAEAKAHGADVILLIAAALSPSQILDLASYAKELSLSVLLEVHNKEELLANLIEPIDAIGVNNRNLKDFSVSISHSLELAPLIPDRYCKVSESGLSDPATIKELKKVGYQGFLIGENFMKEQNPAQAILEFSRSC